MIVTNDKVISIIYELRIDKPDGKIIESLKNDSPLTFLYGSGSLLPKFEDNLAGLSIGDRFNFTLVSEDAYGDMDKNAIVNVPVKAFEIEGKVDPNLVKIGNTIPMQDGQGNRLNGIVKEITADIVTMDFNHPLAGNDLYFSGQILAIREATDEERAHGHIHRTNSCDGCSDCGEPGGTCC
ncbi:MAG: peptidylprolyl isomerase [Bacteroidales bacterium]|nr:peptidylprolyl isomerase [Bacteroidales bacterium]